MADERGSVKEEQINRMEWGSGVLFSGMGVLVWGRERKMRWNPNCESWGRVHFKEHFSHRWLRRNRENRPQHLLFLAGGREGSLLMNTLISQLLRTIANVFCSY